MSLQNLAEVEDRRKRSGRNRLKKQGAVDRLRSDRTRKSAPRFETVCCAGCGRDVERPLGERIDAYCERCLRPGYSHVFPEDIDRRPLGEPEYFGGSVRYDLMYPDGNDDWDDE